MRAKGSAGRYSRPSSIPQRKLCAYTNGGPIVSSQLNWPEFWLQINDVLCACGYARSTRRQFRHVLRALRRDGVTTPGDMSAAVARRFVEDLAGDYNSWSWIAMNISVLRNVFDRICALPVTEGLVTPKRGYRLPEILNESEASRLVQAGETIRDQLLLGLLYGCGITGSEAVGLRWCDVLENGSRLHIPTSTRYRERTLSVPDPLRPVLQAGIEACDPDAYVFRGRQRDTHLSTRMVEVIVRKAASAAQVHRPVCVMTLRHSYAVFRLEHGVNLRQLQEELGLTSIRTVERYKRCIAPTLDRHPLSEIRRRMAAMSGTAPTTSTACRSSRDPRHSSVAPSSRPLSALATIDIRNLQLPLSPPEPHTPVVAFLLLMKDRLGSMFRRPRAP